MPFVPSGKKAARKRAEQRAEQKRDRQIDAAVAAVKVAIRASGACLQVCFVLERFLKLTMPNERFSLRLGALHLDPVDGSAGLQFDPRGPRGVDDGYHAWLEDPRGEILDPSIAFTLAAHDFKIEPDLLIQARGRVFQTDGIRFTYEELADLEVLHLDEAEPFVRGALEVAVMGSREPTVLFCPLDIAWRLHAERA